MSLDKQRILNELGSVMNQLKSADCGCMGKLFSNPDQNQSPVNGMPLPTCGGCRRGCHYGHGSMNHSHGSINHGSPCAGEPYSMSPATHSINAPCMGGCNPPKLYSDTYNYLNQNMMQPVVNEVYNDLKSISPANTVMNNSMANQLGLSQGNPASQGNTGSIGNSMQNNNLAGMEASSNNTPLGQPQPPMSSQGGMGPQIFNMIMGNSGRKPSNIEGIPGQEQSTRPISNADAGQFTAMNPGGNPGQYQHMSNAYEQGNMPGFGHPPTQYVSKENMYSTENAQGSPMMMGNMSQGVAQLGRPHMGNMNNEIISGKTRNDNSAVQQISNGQSQYGQHTQGVMKFKEMFPGLMQGDLGFDPMKIAIQMNPANQQKAAMNTMRQAMNENPINRLLDPQNTQQYVSKTIPYQQNIPSTQADGQNIAPGQLHSVNSNAGAVSNSLLQHQVNTSMTGHPPLNHQQYNQQQPQQQERIETYHQLPDSRQEYQQQQFNANPNAEATLIPQHLQGHNGIVDSNSQQPLSQAVPQMNMPAPGSTTKEPILPSDSSKNQSYSRQYFNTLGQPVEMLPAGMYHPPEPRLPQTLSPQHMTKLSPNPRSYSNVKSTVSKTSIVGNKAIGRTPSRSQLRHLYNEYKGSQSFTQQNVNPSTYAGSFSEGKLNVQHTNENHQRQVPVERVGGDTAANNQSVNQPMPNKPQQVMGQIGDAPVSNKPDTATPYKAPASPIPEHKAKLRNGLQDMVFTSYPTSTAWSFHGP